MADKIQSTTSISDGFYILSFGFVCMYLLRSRDGLIGFDAGMKPEKVHEELGRLKLEAGEVKHIIFTHSDRDHVGGLPAFPAARVLLPRDEVAMIDRTTPRFFGFIYNKPFADTYETLSDGQELTIGERSIRCIATPGHTAGHMSYLIDGSILIVGDTLNLRDGKIVMDRRYINIDNGKRRTSIERLVSLAGVRYLCTMHSGYTDDFAKAVEGWK